MFDGFGVFAEDEDILNIAAIDQFDLDFTARVRYVSWQDVVDLLAGHCNPLLIRRQSDISDRQCGSDKNLLQVSRGYSVFAYSSVFAPEYYVVVLAGSQPSSLLYSHSEPLILLKPQHRSPHGSRAADRARHYRRF